MLPDSFIEKNAPPNKVLIFTYGSNMDLAQMKDRCPHSGLESFIGEARNWKLCFPRESKYRKGGVGSKEIHEGSSVWGVIFSVNERDLESLDRHEGVPKGRYIRGPAEIHKEDGTVVQTQTYFAVRQREQDFLPHRDYIDLYVRGAKHFGLPTQYIEFLENLLEEASSE